MYMAKCLEYLLQLLKHFLATAFFPEGVWGVHNTHGNCEGWEVIFAFINWKY